MSDTTALPAPRRKGQRTPPEVVEAQFRTRLEELGATLLEPRYLGNQRPHRIRCAAGHELTTTPGSVRRGWRVCRICAGLDPKVAEAAFRARLDELGATLLEGTYLGSNKPHRTRCAEGHEFNAYPSDLARGRGHCLSCTGRDPQQAEAAFRARVEELGGVVLEPTWKGVSKPHLVRCPEGHESTPRPSGVKAGGGICRTCAGVEPQVGAARFRARVEALGGTVLDGDWNGTARQYRVMCADGHESRVYPGNVQRQGMCRFCAGKAWDIFYVVLDDIADVVKLGITSHDPGPRLEAHERDGFDRVVRLCVGLPEGTAPELERNVLAALRDAGEKPVRGKEYFPARVLPLVLDLVDNHPAIAAHRSEGLTG